MISAQNSPSKKMQSSKNEFSSFIIILAFIFVALTITFSIFYSVFSKSIFLTFAISFGTTAYHFVMRLFVGLLINKIFHNQLNYQKKCFQEKKFEKNLYKKLKVKVWKDKMPSFAPDTFNLSLHSPEEIVGATCQAEIIHTIIVLLSFLPIFASIFWKTFWVFFITSVLAAALDLLFVIIQRFNRPRILKILRLTEK